MGMNLRKRAGKAESGAKAAAARGAAAGGKSDGAPTAEEVAARAYEIYRRRGGEHGYDLDDWFEAERELLRERGN